MKRDILFVLKEKFDDGPGPAYFCPHCAEVTGILTYFPHLRHQLDVRYVDFKRPRSPMVDMIGESNQNCPMLVLAEKPSLDTLEMMTGSHDGRYFVSGPRDIARYWSHVHNISRPH